VVPWELWVPQKKMPALRHLKCLPLAQDKEHLQHSNDEMLLLNNVQCPIVTR
jgi:hypothetical protein